MNKKDVLNVRKDIKVEDWIEIKYDGRTHLVSMRTLIIAYLNEKYRDKS